MDVSKMRVIAVSGYDSRVAGMVERYRIGCRLRRVTLVDATSGKAPSGARGHKVVLASLLGWRWSSRRDEMGIMCGRTHGIITALAMVYV